MNILSFFVIIPLVMLLGLWVSRSIAQVRGVMVAGSTALLALAAWLTLAYIGLRNSGATDEMLFTDNLLFCGSGWNIGCDAFTECCYCFYRDVCFMEAETID